MAVFQKIRDNSLLSLIVVGGGLFLFIIGDYFKSGNSSFAETDSVGEFDGTDISQAEFEAYYSKMLYLNGKQQSGVTDQEKQTLTSQTWNQLLMEKIFDSEGSKNGVVVTEGEIEEMMVGQNLSNFYVYRLFNGQQNYQNIRQELTQSPENYANPKFTGGKSYQEAEMLKNFGVELRKQEKLMSLIKNSFFSTKSLAKNLYESKYTKKTVALATVPYYLVPDSLISVTDSEVKDFYEQNKGKYKLANASKKVVFGTYSVDPTSEDDSLAKADAIDIVKFFKNEDNDELFVRSESEDAYDDNYYKKGSGLATDLDNELFDKEKGYVYGPYVGYKEGNKTYNVAKVVDVQMMPDSAKVSQVLLTPEDLIQQLIATHGQNPPQEKVLAMWKAFDAQVDSVEKALNNGAGFESITKDYSKDSVSAAKGGDLGWIQEKSQLYPKQFLDSVFMENKSNSTVKKVKVNLQNGGYYYFHLVKVDQMGPKAKKLKVGVITKSVLPSDKTRNNFFNKISQVAIALNNGSSLVSLRDSFNFEIDSALVQPQQYVLNNMTGARKLIYWAFNEADKNQSEVFDLDRKYVVAMVTESNKAGYQSWNEEVVKGEIENKVKKLKKAEYVANKLKGIDVSDFNNILAIFPGASVTNNEGVVIKDGISNLSYEANLTGLIAGLSKGNVSNVISGADGAYLVKVTEEFPATYTEETNLDLEQASLNQDNTSKLDYFLQELITEKIAIEDNRQVLK